MGVWEKGETLYQSGWPGGNEQGRKEGTETFVWLEVRSNPLDECEGVSLLPVCFRSALLRVQAPPSACSQGVTSHPRGAAEMFLFVVI